MENYSILSQINIAKDCADETTNLDIRGWINQLLSADGLTRMRAREMLICFGKFAVPELLHALSSDNPQLRWQAIKVIEDIDDPSSVPALVECLKDENAGIRWAASGALLSFKRRALAPLFEALIRDSGSLWLRQGAHHILHMLKDYGRLNQTEEKVLAALEDVEPDIAVPWAAGKALEEMRINKITPPS